jgi:hypothetical protein
VPQAVKFMRIRAKKEIPYEEHNFDCAFADRIDFGQLL